MLRRYWWVAAVVVFFAGWLASWAWNRPPLDWRQWQERVKQYQADSVRYNDEIIALREIQREMLGERDSLLVERDSATARAGRAERRSAMARSRADSLSNVLANLPPEQRLPVCMDALTARTEEATSCREQAGLLRTALEKDSAALRRTDSALALERTAHQNTRNRLTRANGLLDSLPRLARCPLPFCAAVSLTGDPWEQRGDVQVTIPVGWPWLRLGMNRTLLRGKN